MQTPNQFMRERIVRFILPEVIRRWLDKNEDYGDTTVFMFGPKAQVMDVQRKVGKLINSIWYEKPVKFESPIEVAQDCIGHLLMLIHMLEDEERGISHRYDSTIGRGFNTADFTQGYEQALDQMFKEVTDGGPSSGESG